MRREGTEVRKRNKKWRKKGEMGGNRGNGEDNKRRKKGVTGGNRG